MAVLTFISYSICAILFFYVLRFIKIYGRIYRLGRKLPGPPHDHVLIGNLTFLHTTPENIFKRFAEFGKIFYPLCQIFSVHRVGVLIMSPEDCELIMSNPVHNEKGYIYKLLHKWLKFGLLTSSGTKWQIRRKILTPAFHFNTLQQFMLVFNEEAEKLVELLKQECKKSYVNITSLITQFTLKSITGTETAMGTKLDFKTEKESKYKEGVYEMGRILLYRLMHPWFIKDGVNLLSPRFLEEVKLRKTLHTFTREIIEEREKNFSDIELPKEEHDVYKGKKRLAMLDLLISAKNKEGIIDKDGIQEEVDTFLFEGHDTTAAALGFILMLVACHKEVQAGLVEEMGEILGDPHKKPTYNDLQNLKYMERCIKESLRLYPSVYFISRTLGEDVITHNGSLLPKGITVVICIYIVHRNPDIYPDPDSFDPDRFLPERCQNRHPYAYIPFSAGPRNCIGQRFAMLELKAALCSILANFILEPIDTPETITLVVDIVLRTKEEIKVRFISRDEKIR